MLWMRSSERVKHANAIVKRLMAAAHKDTQPDFRANRIEASVTKEYFVANFIQSIIAGNVEFGWRVRRAEIVAPNQEVSSVR
ncbi:hypothetical protein GB937_006145 [Aspergillus fischeri]|nr:hypothetical protein GB937_006145 [Aspergillus fischeri]